ncbi:Ribosomal_protein S15 [Hexamita inflata]|uniref:Ribosomal protein S15 n=1 Tax=Hexamita inflata TaxID=28002 RepID=A0AA86UEH4_9EUKA|nr:Ribosomal protein S15 [Hexamita inflata]CAI9974310.1 Ribosomal protein S15 [Hexamita inflata]
MKLDLKEIGQYTRARVQRKLTRGLSTKQLHFMEKVRKTRDFNKTAPKPKIIKTHLRDMIVTPEMVGMTISCYNGKQFIPIEVKHNMLGMYLGEFAMSYKSVKHGKAGIGATRGSTAVSLK